MNQIQHLRTLLEAYYSGCSTPEQAMEIAELFHQIRQLPDDLKADREIFLALAGTTPLPAATSESLDRLVASTIDACAGRTKRRRRMIIWISAISAAAAIALIVTIATSLTSDSRPSMPTDPIFSAAPAVTPEATKETSTEKKQSQLLVAQASDQTTVKTLKRPKKIAKAKTEPVAATNVRVVTDPEEAAYYAENAFRLLSENLSRSTILQRQTSATLGDMKSEISNALNILQ